MQPTIRLLRSRSRWPTNMAADEAMLLADSRRCVLRWSPATLSSAIFNRRPAASELPWVRGRPATDPSTITSDVRPRSPRDCRADRPAWMRRMHEILQSALADLGVETQLAETEQTSGDFLVYTHTVATSLPRTQDRRECSAKTSPGAAHMARPLRRVRGRRRSPASLTDGNRRFAGFLGTPSARGSRKHRMTLEPAVWTQRRLVSSGGSRSRIRRAVLE